MVIDRFNKGCYIGDQMIHQEKKSIATRKISSKKTRKNNNILSLMDDAKLMMAVGS